MLVVVDTNIIVSVLLSPDSTAFTFLSEILDGKHTVLICEEIYKEYQGHYMNRKVYIMPFYMEEEGVSDGETGV